MAIARFINTKEIMDIYNERNPTNRIAEKTAAKWRDEWKEEHPNAKLPGNTIIPYIWFEEHYGEDAYRGLTLDELTMAKLDLLRISEGMSRSEFVCKIIDECIKKTQVL